MPHNKIPAAKTAGATRCSSRSLRMYGLQTTDESSGAGLTFWQGPPRTAGRSFTESSIYVSFRHGPSHAKDQHRTGGRPMEMLLMGACLSMFGLAVMPLAFGAATRRSEERRRAGEKQKQ